MYMNSRASVFVDLFKNAPTFFQTHLPPLGDERLYGVGF